MIKEPEFVQGTLEWCNSIRWLKGMKPLKRLPKGIRGDVASCPCGTATGVGVGSEGTWAEKINAPSYGNKLPQCVIEFVCAFDTKQLPQYDQNI